MELNRPVRKQEYFSCTCSCHTDLSYFSHNRLPERLSFWDSKPGLLGEMHKNLSVGNMSKRKVLWLLLYFCPELYEEKGLREISKEP